MKSVEKSKDRELSAGLLRQRRNLLGTSIAMALFFASGATVEKINILGTVITLSNPQIVPYGLAILFTYFLLRYWQYYREENHIISMKKAFLSHLCKLEKTYFYRKATAGLLHMKGANIQVYYLDPKMRERGSTFDLVTNESNTWISPLTKKLTYCLHTDSGVYSGEIGQFHEYMSTEESGRKPLKLPNRSLTNGDYYKGSFIYSPFLVFLFRFIGSIRYMLSESYFTDYQLPFILAFLAAAISLCGFFM